MQSLARKLVLPFLIGAAAAASAQAADCGKDVEACIRLAAAETAAYADACGKMFPDSKAGLDAALAQWSVRKLQVPGLEAALQPGSPDRVALAKKAAAYLKSAGGYEREIECTARLAMLKSKEPKLRADFVDLPRNALEPYLR